MSRKFFLSAALTAAMVLIASMLILSASCSDAFAKVSPPAKVTVDFGAKHAALAQTVANAINENSGREGSDYAPYNEYGPLQCTVSGSVISLDFPTVAGDEFLKEGNAYAFFREVTYKAIEKTDYKDQGEQFLSVGKNTIDKYTDYSGIWEEFDFAYTINLGEKLSLNILWEKPVTKASFTVSNALCGTEVKIEEGMPISDSPIPLTQSPEPEVTADEGSELIFPKDWGLPKVWLKTIDALEPAGFYMESEKWFSGKLTPETEVYVAICTTEKFGYYIDPDIKMDITVNGEKAELLVGDGEDFKPVVAKVTITHKYGPWKKLDDSQHQKICEGDPSHVLKENHTWDKGKVTRKATTTSKGSKTFTCTACKATKTEDIPKLKPSKSKALKPLGAKMTSKGKNRLKIGWAKVKGADGYEVFFAECNHSGKEIVCKKATTVKGNKTLSWSAKGLKPHKSYKAYVLAYAMKDGTKTYINKSPLMHAFTTGGTKRYTNARSVIVKKRKVTLQEKKTFKIKATVIKLKKDKKLMSKNHAPRLRFRSSDSKVATVSKGGTIKARSAGSCVIYVLAHNGVYKTVKVTVL